MEKSNMLIMGSDETIQEINRKIEELEKIMDLLVKKKIPLAEFDHWRLSVGRLFTESFTGNSISKDFLTETKAFLNKFSDIENAKSIEITMNRAKSYLQEVKRNVESGKYEISKSGIDYIDKSMALFIIKRILRNFHKHIEAMYQDDVHRNGKISKKDLDRIRIGNEYDVQRILYALIRPIFPTARLEVPDDVGYQSVRYDIVIKEYDIIIEVKCTRENMTQRKLTEELGADSFHYNADHLFLFIFDRVRLIKNPDAFEGSFNRQKRDDGRDIETIVIQEVIFN